MLSLPKNLLDVPFQRRLMVIGGLFVLFTLLLFAYFYLHFFHNVQERSWDIAFFSGIFLFEIGFMWYLFENVIRPLFLINKNFKELIAQKTKNLSDYKQAIDASVLVSKTDSEGVITYANDKFCSVSGYSRKELIGKTHRLVKHPNMPTEVFEDMWKTITAKNVWNGVIKNKKKNGGEYWVNSTIIPILDLNGNILEFLSIRSDITELKTAEEKLSKSYEKLREFNTALENISTTIIITALDGTIEYVNTAFEKNTGYTKEEAIGKNSTLLQSKYPSNAIYEQISKTIHGGRVWTGELLNKKKNGEDIYEKVTISPVFNADGTFHKFITVKVDITDEVQLSKNLTESFKKLVELDKKKDEFVSIASHELKTPLSIIKGYVSLFESGSFGSVTEKQKEYLKRILGSTNQLLALIQDMLDLSKLKSGKMEFHVNPLSLEDFLENIQQEFSLMYKEKGLTFSIHNTVSEKEIYTDSNRLHQVLVNLLSNAYKFTSQGEVFLKVIQNDAYVQFSVKDSGVGIPQDKISQIFDRFSQVENHLQRDYQGTGLGLTIVKEIVGQLGGTIEVQSQEGIGSEFTFTLPRKRDSI